jgi:hypothetical protein
MQEDQVKSIEISLCPWGNGFSCDTVYEGRMCCKLCSPAYESLEQTPEERRSSLKILWGTPFKGIMK